MSFAAEGTNLHWRMDGKGHAAQWLPWPGRHVVQLVDARGTVLDEIRLEVRARYRQEIPRLGDRQTDPRWSESWRM